MLSGRSKLSAGFVGVKSIALLGQGGSPNLGDVAIHDAIIAGIRARIPDANIVILAPNAATAKKLHNVDAIDASRPRRRVSLGNASRNSGKSHRTFARKIADRIGDMALELRFLARYFRRLRSFDLVVVSGGGQMGDYWGGAWQQPYLLFKWALLSRAAGVRFEIFSVGVDFLSRYASNLFLGVACRLASYVSFRDVESLAEARRRRLVRAASVCPDMAYSLSLPVPSIKKVNAVEQGRVVGISPISPLSWPVSRDVYCAYLDTLAVFSSRLVGRGHRIMFFVSQVTMDPPAVDEIRSRLQLDSSRKEISVAKVMTLKDLVSAIDGCNVVVASRLHSIILSHVRYRPVIALSYCNKTASVMRQMEQTELCVDAEHVTVAALETIMATVERQYHGIAGHIAAKVNGNRALLDEQYDRFLLPVGCRRH